MHRAEDVGGGNRNTRCGASRHGRKASTLEEAREMARDNLASGKA